MNFLLRSPKFVEYTSHVWHDSESFPGVRFATRRISLSSRIELAKMVGEIAQKNEFLRAGDVCEQAGALVADLLARKVYLEWGVCQIDGLTIDGQPASLQSLVDHGPECLCNEIVSIIRSELSLSEEERKNS